MNRFANMFEEIESNMGIWSCRLIIDSSDVFDKSLYKI